MRRRQFLKYSLATYFAPSIFMSTLAKSRTLVPSSKTRTIIFLHMNGGPSQLDLYEYKPELIKKGGKSISYFVSEKGQKGGTLLAPISNFSKTGKSGLWASDLLPQINKHIDEMAFLKSMNCHSLLHEQAQLEQFTGSTHPGKPHIGTWINHQIFNCSSKNTDQYKMPGFFHFSDPLGTMRTYPYSIENNDINAKKGFLNIDKISKLKSALKKTLYDDKSAKQYLRLLNDLQGESSQNYTYSSLVLESRNTISKLIGNSPYNKKIQQLYGVSDLGENHLVDQLVLSKKLAMQNVPYIQINVGNEEDETSWDHHFNLNDLKTMCEKIDRPISSFIQDLKNENLLDQVTLVWGGEFGRLPMIDTKGPPNINSSGRGHNNLAGTIWLMGAGIKKGVSFGETDEIGLTTVRDPVYYRDVWATLLNLMGLEQRNLVFNENNLNLKFFKEPGKILNEILE